MIDMSHLTEEEHEMILAVLRRDTELKKKEEQRIEKLKKTEKDKLRLKFLTGEWFYETKVSRHRDKTNGTDIIKNSMTQRKPVTILEVTQIWPENTGFLRNETKDVFVPPELSGIIQEDNSREDPWQMANNKPSAYSQFKPRRNPFNTKPLESTKEPDGLKYTSENATKVPQITVNSHQICEESQLSPAKPYETPQSPAEDHHEDHAEPCSSQLSEPHGSLIEQGKNLQLSPEGSLAEDDRSSINKVLGWCGKSSRDDNKRREKLGDFEEQDKDGTESQNYPEKENTPPTPAAIKAKPSPKPRRGLLALFSKQEPEVESPEHVLTKEHVMSPNDDDEYNLTSEFQVPVTHPNAEVDDKNEVQSSTSNQNMATEEHEEVPLLFITEDKLDTAVDDIQQTYPYDAEKSQNRLASLRSFWEKGNKGPKILSIKQGPDTRHNGMPKSSGDENKALDQKMSEDEITQSKAPKLECSEDTCGSYEDFPKSYSRSSSGGNFSVTPSHEKNTFSVSVDAVQKPVEHGLQIHRRTAEESPKSPTEQTDDSQIHIPDEILPPVPTVRKTLVEKGTEPAIVSKLGSFREKENDCPKIIINTHKCVPDINTVTSPRHYSQQGTNKSPVDESSASPNPVRGGEVHEMTALSKKNGEQNLTEVTLDDRNRMHYFTHDTYPLIPHKSAFDKSNQDPRSSLVQESSDLTRVSVHPRTLSPRQTPMVPPRELYPITESRMVCSPMRVFNIDITPVKMIKVESLEHMRTTRNRTKYPHGPSHSEESSPGSDGNDLGERMEQSVLTPSGNASEQSKLRSPHSSVHLRKSQSPGNVSIGNVSSPAHSQDITEYPSPVRRQNKLTVRPISISKSLEDLVTQPSNESWKNDPRSGMSDGNQMLLPALDPEKMKRLSMSVPGFLQQQGIGEESDCLSMDSFCSDRRRKSSTNTNFSASSGHASLSSVSGSRMNIHGAYFGHVEVKGTIQFAINYVNKLEEFHIFIVRCRDLAAAEPKRNRSDPYVKCYLLPDKAKLGKKKTTVKKKTLNPTYNEILRYRIPLDSLKGHILNLSVWHHDMFGRNSFLGEVDVDLSEWDINNTHMMDCALKSRASAPSSPTYINHSLEKMGEMRVALRFLLQTSSKMPQTGEIQIWVKECRNLFSRRGTVDSFVKCSLLPDSNQKSRQKSRVVKKTAKPVFNHTMVYDGIRLEDLKETCVELTVWDHDRLSNHFIGGTRLGLGTGKSYSLAVNWMDSSPLEAELWKRMIESVNEWVEDTVPLRMLIMTRTVPR